MTDDLDQVGPIDYLVVEFPGNKMTGEAFPILVDLADRGIIRILDLVFLRKELDGSVVGMAIADFDSDGELDLAVFEGASSGLLDDSDIDEAGVRPGAGQLRRRARLREHLGGAVRHRPAAVRWPAGRQRPDPRPGHPRGSGSRPSRSADRSTRRREGRQSCRVCSEASHGPPSSRGQRPHVSNNVSRRQAGRWAEKDAQQQQQQQYAEPQYAPPPAAPAGNDMDAKLAQLKDLGALKEQGVLTDEEFAVQKDRILHG